MSLLVTHRLINVSRSPKMPLNRHKNFNYFVACFINFKEFKSVPKRNVNFLSYFLLVHVARIICSKKKAKSEHSHQISINVVIYLYDIAFSLSIILEMLIKLWYLIFNYAAKNPGKKQVQRVIFYFNISIIIFG